jgi:hypothetical protein
MQSSADPAWVPTVGVVITALGALTVAFLTQIGARKGERNATFAKAVEALGDQTAASKRATGIAILTQMASTAGPASSYYKDAIETLSSYVRFERDMYCRDAVLQALRRLDAGHQLATEMLRKNLQDDLLRQIAQYAAKENFDPTDSRGQDAMVQTAPDSRQVIRETLSKEKAKLPEQLAFAKNFPPSEDRSFFAWSIRLTARDLSRMPPTSRSEF